MRASSAGFVASLCTIVIVLGCARFAAAQEAAGQDADGLAPDGALLASSDLDLSPAAMFRSSGSAAVADEWSLEPARATLGAAPFSLAGPTAFALQGDSGGDGSYLVAKFGPLWYFNDLEDLDTGINAEAFVGTKLLEILAIELGGGYFWGQDDGGTEQTDLWGIPILAQARVGIPITFLEPYAGVGAGAFYFNIKADDGTGSKKNESMVFGWDAFVGLNIHITKLIIGIEGKYVRTQEFAAPGDDPRLEGFALMGCFGLSF